MNPTPPDATQRTPTAAGERELAVAALFCEHQGPMLRLATLLGADDPEDIVGEAFYQVFRRWHRLRDANSAVAYLRAVTCNLTRMRIRHLQVARKHQIRATLSPITPDTTSAASELRDDQRQVLTALKQLPTRQREALVLRYWLDLSQTEIAATMGISAGAVKAHTSRGMAALARLLEHDTAASDTEGRRARPDGQPLPTDVNNSSYDWERASMIAHEIHPRSPHDLHRSSGRPPKGGRR